MPGSGALGGQPGAGGGSSAGRLVDLRYLPCDWTLALGQRTAPLAAAAAAATVPKWAEGP